MCTPGLNILQTLALNLFSVCWRGGLDQVDASCLRRRTPADRRGLTSPQQTHQYMVIPLYDVTHICRKQYQKSGITGNAKAISEIPLLPRQNQNSEMQGITGNA